MRHASFIFQVPFIFRRIQKNQNVARFDDNLHELTATVAKGGEFALGRWGQRRDSALVAADNTLFNPKNFILGRRSWWCDLSYYRLEATVTRMSYPFRKNISKKVKFSYLAKSEKCSSEKTRSFTWHLEIAVWHIHACLILCM